ncbi:PREDICTED: solute carrier family 46 member 3 [Bactrocera latifrons]|uniref:Proton-coupled folate transporter n=4 Tax=Bactrocera latifrons TaxID=174628 RepID=A0A0K8WKB4_BACLA|nr:PREDICTED: solute carrier family 46 member 3 [Bactrocera latifrons]XP_018800466.1 PREDICTED: solute carrier family 46 member 3 [Bactrocera latifrons]XP_018800467.1 PREDICTED: solute carrier family 46 member 3 [Bactrocera latifrons]XP_018800468.1 PREDICTED: solute carrier family 46 member 3 [Bactrocera latifrons]XP_018800469.1 PREDICTED: solute carrier family 46 member 3 [Bactrocera latifrons]XP_018800470.1 PREDICTED: solute carrier family 46 member 3 [Bactrocera latifrons]XP_018800471.1 PR
MGHSAADTTIASPAGTNMAIATITPITAKSVEASEKPAQKPKLTWREKLQKVINNITVEPILAAYIMPSVLSGLATQNLNLEKACRVNMDYGEVVCDALTRRDTANYTLEEETVQQMVARMAAWKTVIQSMFPCLLILFWGSWSDRHHRRKPCILIPIIGEFLGTVGLILCVYFERTPMEVAALTEAIFPSLSGGWFTMLMGVFSYIADITTEEERTLRIGILNVCFSVGVPIGMAFSGLLLKQIGFYGVFSISASLYLFSFLYGLFFLAEPRAKPEKSVPKGERKSLLADFFDKDHVVETFRVAFKRGENQRRQRVIMLMVVVMVVIGPMHGEMSVTYLFTRFRFNWSEVEFSVFSTYAMITGLVGVLFCVGILSHKLKIDDALVGVISSMSKILSGFVYAFATVPWHMYVGAIVEIFNGTAFIAMRSIATKLVRKDELGKVNSLFGVAEALMPMVFAPMYTTLYAATLKVLPGAFYLLGGTLTAPAVFIFLWMYNFQRKQQRKAITQAADSEAGAGKADCLDAKDANGNINAIEAIALASEAKGQLNGIVTNVIHENLEQAEHAAECVQRDTEARAAVVAQAQTLANGMENRAFEDDDSELRQRQQTRV